MKTIWEIFLYSMNLNLWAKKHNFIFLFSLQMALGLLFFQVLSRTWKTMVISNFQVKKSCTKELNNFPIVLSEEQNHEILLVYVLVFKEEN